jgi:C1A family cysteine protease
MPGPYFTGHVRAPNKDHLINLSNQRHAGRMRALLAVPTPAQWDSVAKGWVGPPKDQSQCGSCWDFSGTGVVEIAYNLAGMGGGPNKFILSEQYTLSCARNGGCGGDDNVTVLTEAKATGIPLTADYGPYHGSAGRCSYQAGQKLYKIDDWGFANASGDQGQTVTPVEDIKAAIMHYGCVGAAIAADNAFSNAQAGGVFKGSGSQDIDHDIILVGWDDSKAAWKLRNSWGPSWCDGGYCWIAYGANLVGTEAVWAVVHNTDPPPLGWADL